MIQKIPLSLARWAVSLQNSLVLKFSTFSFMSELAGFSLNRIGSKYGGWWIPERILRDSSNRRVVISLGIGMDVSFDEELLKSGFVCIGLDPIKKYVDFAQKRLGTFQNLYLENLGIATYSGKQRFYPPEKSGHTSWTSTSSKKTIAEWSEEFEVISLPDLLFKYRELLLNSLVVLKMDIDGAEK